MIMDAKGKLFGKVSIVDCVVVLIVIAALAGAYFRFFRTDTRAATSRAQSEFYYTLVVKGIRQPTVDALQKSGGTAFKLEEKAVSDMGVMLEGAEGLEVRPATDYVTKTDGTVVLSELPERYDVYITFQVQGYISDDGYFTKDSYELNAGSEYVVKNKFVSFTGNIERVWE